MVLEWQVWIGRRLEPADVASVGTIEVDLAPSRRMNLGVLLYSWHLHVAKLVADVSADRGDRTVWGAPDYVAALVIRDAVATGIERLGSGVGEKIVKVADEVDLVFRNYTEEDADGCAERVFGESSIGGWWWARLPRFGPVRQEIEAQYGHA